MANKQTIILTNNPIVGEYITIRITNGINTLSLWTETFVNVRSKSGESSIKTDAQRTAYQYSNALRFDYGNAINVSNFGNQVIVEIKDNGLMAGWAFVNPSYSATIDYITENETLPDPQSISFAYEPNVSNPCGLIDVKYTIQGGELPYSFYKNGVLSESGVTSPFVDSIARNGQPVQVEFRDSNGNPIRIGGTSSGTKFSVVGVRKLNSNDVSLDIANYSAGSNVTVNVSFQHSLVTPYEYSLNGVDWQSDNRFTSIPPNEYTLYIRDALGCVYTETFVIDGVTTLSEVVSYISEINPIRFIQTDLSKKNYFNTLSFIENRQLHYRFIQNWIETDKVTTQLKTNAQYIGVNAVDCHGAKTPIQVIKKVDNTGLIGYSTVTLFRSQNNLGALYYGVVDLLNPDTDAIIQTKDYKNTLPPWVSEGQELDIDGVGFSKVNRVYFSEDYNSLVAELDFAYTSTPVDSSAKATYNLQPYDLYEFEVDMSLMPDQFQITIEVGNSENDIKFAYISEIQSKFEDNDRYVEIKYSDDENIGGMNYQTGVKHLIRLEAYQDYQGEHSVDGYNGDTRYYATQIELYNSENIIFPRLTTGMAQKVRMILSHGNLTINSVPCTLSEGTEITNMPSSNLNKLTANVKIGGEEFNEGQADNLIDTEGGGFAGIESYKDLGLLTWTKND